MKKPIKYTPACAIIPYVLFIMAVCLSGHPCMANEPLTWLNFGQIPAYIQKGDYTGKGFIDQTIQWIHKTALTEYEPRYLNVNHKRFNIVAKQKNNCYIGWKTFSDYRTFSDPFAIWFPSGIIIHKKKRGAFGPQGALLSLEDLIQRDDLKLGIIEDFAYAPQVLEILSAHQDAKHVYPNITPAMQIDLTMLLNGRVDYIIGWPSQPIVTEKLYEIPNEFIFYNMKEDQTYLYIGVSCGTCDTGKRVIQKINTMFKNPENFLKAQSFIDEWVVLSDQYKTLFRQTIVERQPHPLVTHMVYPQ